MSDFAVTYSKLEELASHLPPIIDEFDKAEDRADVLEAAIGDPFGRNDLREAAEDFEDRWNNKRDELREGLQTIHDAVKNVLKHVQEKDADFANQYESATSKATAK